MLWQRAEELSEERNRLSDESAYLYTDLEEKRRARSHADEESMKKEKRYWELGERMREIEAEEAEIQNLLEKISENVVTENDLERIRMLTTLRRKKASPTKSEGKKKKETKITQSKSSQTEEFNALEDIFGNSGSVNDPNRLTTGRHAKRVKGNISVTDAEGEFFHRTADTHGGKVDYGKKKEKDTYVSRSGKRIRKR